jgi:hypothetical protein
MSRASLIFALPFALCITCHIFQVQPSISGCLVPVWLVTLIHHLFRHHLIHPLYYNILHEPRVSPGLGSHTSLNHAITFQLHFSRLRVRFIKLPMNPVCKSPFRMPAPRRVSKVADLNKTKHDIGESPALLVPPRVTWRTPMQKALHPANLSSLLVTKLLTSQLKRSVRGLLRLLTSLLFCTPFWLRSVRQFIPFQFH